MAAKPQHKRLQFLFPRRQWMQIYGCQLKSNNALYSIIANRAKLFWIKHLKQAIFLKRSMISSAELLLLFKLSQHMEFLWASCSDKNRLLKWELVLTEQTRDDGVRASSSWCETAGLKYLWAAWFNINFVAKSVASVSHFFVVQPTGKLEIFVNT